ncbi:hypothetical protein KPL70_021557 [Citrus sinensis]|nr:hypothetical protein KPL70_021557 [Citrus sinensis]
MVDAIVSPLLEQLISISYEEAKQQVRLVAGVGKQVKKLTSNLRAIQAVLNDAEQRQVKEESVRLWLDQLKEASYDMEDVLDEWITARLKLQIEGVDENALVRKKPVCSFFLSCCIGFKKVVLRRDIAQKIIEINENLDDIAKQKDVFNFNVIRGSTEKSERIHSTAIINVSDVRGRDEEKNTLKSKLLCESNEQQNAVQIISLVGMGGIGKTTLAQFAYNDKDVIENFDKRIWVCVSDPFDEFRIAKAIIEGLEGSLPNLGELNSLLEYIHTSIKGKKFFLILDDVWTDDYSKWEPFHNCLMNGLCGSRILVTTRKETVARMMESTDVISIKELSEHECWSLFKRFAFSGRSPTDCEQLEEIGRKIVGKCKGLPLAAKTIGSLLRFKKTREEWQLILNSEMWQLEDFEKNLLAPLQLSYNDLPPEIKLCFLYCVVFPKDYDLDKDELVRLWMAQGYIEKKGNIEMEMTGGWYFDFLASRSFFQDFDEDEEGIVTCKMHDIVHDFAQYLTRKEFAAIEVDGDENPLSLTSTCQEKLRHLTLTLGLRAKFPVSILDAKKLRGLILFYDCQGELAASRGLQGLFDQLTCLRALKIEDLTLGDKTIEIPRGLENLIHLRYLQLSSVEELPETCCELLNLQTLDCLSLIRLPQGIGKLINLRHLIFDEFGVDYVPNGFERLTGLRTLSGFTVARVDGEYSSKACNLEGLGNLNHLRGFLRICGLGNVTDADEAKNAHLEKKKNLVCLILDFTKREDEDYEEAPMWMNEENEAKQEAICEALRAPPNIESLKITGFEGRRLIFSCNWTVSLDKLKRLNLKFFPRCEIMPPLGKLPSLEILTVRSVNSVKKVGDEFLGIEIRDHNHIHGTFSSSLSSSIVAFPKLEQLTLRSMDELEEWDFVKEDITIMPKIKSFTLRYCMKLKSLPDQLLRSTTLESLEIDAVLYVEQYKRQNTKRDAQSALFGAPSGGAWQVVFNLDGEASKKHLTGLLANFQERNDLKNDQHLVTAAVVVCATHDCALWPACEEKKFLICYFLSYVVTNGAVSCSEQAYNAISEAPGHEGGGKLIRVSEVCAIAKACGVQYSRRCQYNRCIKINGEYVITSAMTSDSQSWQMELSLLHKLTLLCAPRPPWGLEVTAPRRSIKSMSLVTRSPAIVYLGMFSSFDSPTLVVMGICVCTIQQFSLDAVAPSVVIPLSKLEKILRDWPLRMTSEELVKVKSSAGTDTYVYTTESKQAHGHQNQTWQIVRLLPKGSLSADSPSNYQVHTIQKRAISSVNLNTANSELLPGTSNQSSQANIVSTAKGHSYRRFQNICLLCIYYKGHVNL